MGPEGHRGLGGEAVADDVEGLAEQGVIVTAVERQDGLGLAIGVTVVAALLCAYLLLGMVLAINGNGRGGACDGPACGVGVKEPGNVLSPGGWEAPDGTTPGWSWVPPAGAAARPDLAPSWVRVWFELPYLDRYASAWMWEHGAFEVEPPASP